MAKNYVYEGNDDVFTTPTGKVLYAMGEAVELEDADAAYVRRYPYGRHKLREVAGDEVETRRGANNPELVVLIEGAQAMEVTPSTSGTFDLSPVVVEEAPTSEDNGRSRRRTETPAE